MAPSVRKSGSGASSGLVDGNNPSLISLEGSNFVVNGHIFLSDVPDNITLSPSPATLTEKTLCDNAGSFVGFDSKESKDRHVVHIGKLKNIKFMSIFRFKVWWTTHWVGSNGGDLEHETQMVMLDKSDDSGRPYVLLLPLIEGPFRASLQPGDDDNVDVCVESGSTKVCAAGFRSVVYLHAGDDPFNLVKEAMEAVRVHLGTFKLLEEKTPPGIVDKFGWCTWDAFYLTVHPQGVWDGVKGLVDGGCPPGLVLIDDGWQSISHDEDSITEEGMNAAVGAGEQMPCRLLRFQENYKFRDYESLKSLAVDGVDNKGMGAFVKDLKEEFNTVDYVYVWHALCGYWGGLRPNVPGLPPTQVVKPKLSPGLEMTMEDLAVDKIVNNGVGLVPPEIVDQMYDGIHSHLAKVGIDGVKVDVIHETTATVLTAALALKKSEPPSSGSSDIGSTGQGSSSGTVVSLPLVDSHAQPSELETQAASELIEEKASHEQPTAEETITNLDDKTSAKSFNVQKSQTTGDERSTCPPDEDNKLPSSITKSDHTIADHIFSGAEDGLLAQEKIIGNHSGATTEIKEAGGDKKAECTDGLGPGTLDDKKTVTVSSDVHLNIRLPDGVSLQEKFSVTSTLRMVKDYVDRNQAGGIGAYDLAIPYPRKTFSDQDLSKSLSELALLNRQALMVVPHQRATSYHRGGSSSDRATTTTSSGSANANDGGYFAYVKRVLSYVNPFSYFGGSASSSSSGQAQSGVWEYSPNSTPQNNTARTDRPYSGYSPNQNSSATGRNDSQGRPTTTSRIGSNIHTLKHDDDDGRFNDRNSFWNGNSTEYGGNNDGK